MGKKLPHLHVPYSTHVISRLIKSYEKCPPPRSTFAQHGDGQGKLVAYVARPRWTTPVNLLFTTGIARTTAAMLTIGFAYELRAKTVKTLDPPRLEHAFCLRAK